MIEKVSNTMPAVVEKIIKSPDPRDPEKAQIAVEGADALYREIRTRSAGSTPDKLDESNLLAGTRVGERG